MQLILNNSNKRQSGSSPIDWSYAFGTVNSMSQYVQPQAALQFEWLIKSMQILQNGRGPDVFQGWAPYTDLTKIILHDSAPLWLGVPLSTRIALSEGILRAWLAQVRQFTPQQFYNGGWANPNVNPVTGPAMGYSESFADKIWWEIPQYRYLGVNQTLINELADWAKTVWPGANWDVTKTATCQLYVTVPVCSTEQQPVPTL